MADTFENAVVTICGPSAEDAEQGFLHDRQFLQEGPSAPVAIDLPSDEGTTTCLIVQEQPYSDDRFYKEAQHPLARRGWITQERLLSPRVLYFGRYQMYMECAAADFFENCRVPLTPHPHYPGSKPAISRSDRNQLFEHWTSIVQDYSCCDLTEGSDRLPALSGTARRFHDLLGSPYHCGSWRDDLIAALAWCRHQRSQALVARPATVQPPTWSWVSCDYGIRFMHPRRNEFEAHAAVQAISTPPVGLDPYGQVNGGKLTLRAKLKSAAVERVVYTGTNGTSLGSTDRDRDFVVSLDDAGFLQPVARMERDDPLRDRARLIYVDSKRLEDVAIMLLTVHYSEKAGVSRAAPWRWTALVLQRTDDAAPTMRRIGFVEFFRGSPPRCWPDEIYNIEAWHWMDTAEVQTVVIV
ncbi:hypothetical protein LTR65_005022 [Meristemomyces frigidus]